MNIRNSRRNLIKNEGENRVYFCYSGLDGVFPTIIFLCKFTLMFRPSFLLYEGRQYVVYLHGVYCGAQVWLRDKLRCKCIAKLVLGYKKLFYRKEKKHGGLNLASSQNSLSLLLTALSWGMGFCLILVSFLSFCFLLFWRNVSHLVWSHFFWVLIIHSKISLVSKGVCDYSLISSNKRTSFLVYKLTLVVKSIYQNKLG